MRPDTRSRRLLFSAAGILAAYLVATAVAYYPAYDALSGAELFAVVKHLAVVSVLAILLVTAPKLGSVLAFGWGLVVPAGRYTALAKEVMDGTFSTSNTFAPSDAFRLLLLFIATVLAGIAAFGLFIAKSPKASSANADG